jgi:hypothetical protein
MNWIAEDVIFVAATGERTHGRIAVGIPQQDDENTAGCAVALEGLDPPMPGPIRGPSEFTALLNAIAYLDRRIRGFTSAGGRVLFPGEEEDVDLFSALHG